MLTMAFKQLPVFSELSYTFITIFYNFLNHSKTELAKKVAFKIIKTGKAHRLGLLVNFLMRYFTALLGQNDTTLEDALSILLESAQDCPQACLGYVMAHALPCTHKSSRLKL